jgi:hypothetical protein
MIDDAETLIQTWAEDLGIRREACHDLGDIQNFHKRHG